MLMRIGVALAAIALTLPLPSVRFNGNRAAPSFAISGR
jgi:hypothetical protein